MKINSLAKSRKFLVSDYAVKFSQLLLGKHRLKDVAYEQFEIQAPTEQYHPKAIYLENEISRITGVGLSGTIQSEIARVQEHHKIHNETVAYKLKDVLLFKGSFYKSRYKLGIGVTQKTKLSFGFAPLYDKETVLSQSWLGSKFFGHFLVDDIPLNILANQIGSASGVIRPLTAQQKDYAKLFNHKIIDLPEIAHIEHITIVEDYHYNSNKRDRWQWMRNHVINSSKNEKHIGVFLMRGSTGEHRALINEEEVANHLSKKGFRCINPGKSSAQEVIESVANAQIVIGVEGSHLSHGFLGVAIGGSMIVLQPPNRFSAVYKERCDVADIKFGFHVCEHYENGFKADLQSIDKIIDKI